MKALKRFLIVGIWFTAINASGQTGANTSNMTIQQRTDYINQHVTGLTPDQQSKITAIEENYLGKSKTVNGAAMDSLRRDKDNKIRAVLTTEQYGQYLTIAYPH